MTRPETVTREQLEKTFNTDLLFTLRRVVEYDELARTCQSERTRCFFLRIAEEYTIQAVQTVGLAFVIGLFESVDDWKTCEHMIEGCARRIAAEYGYVGGLKYNNEHVSHNVLPEQH